MDVAPLRTVRPPTQFGKEIFMQQSNLAQVWSEPSRIVTEEAAPRLRTQLYPVAAAQPRRPLAKRVKLRSIVIESAPYRLFRVC